MKQEKGVSVYKPVYWIERFGEDEAIKISSEQYAGLERALLDTDMKFIKVGDEIINTNSIKRVFKEAQKPNRDIYQETGANPLYREWVTAGEPLKDFKRWLNERRTN